MSNGRNPGNEEGETKDLADTVPDTVLTVLEEDVTPVVPRLDAGTEMITLTDVQIIVATVRQDATVLQDDMTEMIVTKEMTVAVEMTVETTKIVMSVVRAVLVRVLLFPAAAVVAAALP